MKVIVIGAGIGGLCAGLALRAIGHEVEIFEKVTQIRPVGAGLSLWPNGILCLNHLGLGAEVAALGGRMDSMAYRDAAGAVLTQFPLAPLYDASGARAYPVSRAALQSMLMERFGDGLHLGTALQGIAAADGSVTATCADGRQAQADLLIGADGAHSAVRALMLGRRLERRPAGYTNFNGIIPASPAIAPADSWTTFVAEGKRASVMPIGGDRFYVFFDVPTARQTTPFDDPRAELRHHFGHWCAPVQRMIDALAPEATNRIDIHDIDPFDGWVKGRIVLLGDSAHNTTPDLGQGACMAMEDAVVLQRTLTEHPHDIDAALAEYRDARTARTRDLILRARERSDVTHDILPAATARWYRDLRSETGEGIIRGIRKTVEGGPLAR